MDGTGDDANQHKIGPFVDIYSFVVMWEVWSKKALE